MTITIATDLTARAAAVAREPGAVPSAPTRSQAFGAQLRVQTVQRDGKAFFHFHGVASTVEQPYVMYDWYGEYEEVVDAHAFDVTLAASPDVAFLLNHYGTTMARTKSGTLELGVGETGLAVDAFCNPERRDVADLALAIGDGDIDEMSFAFRIVRGQWSPDYTEYRILEVDLDRGDVSAVNYGANPNTSIAARAKQALAAVEDLPATYLRALQARAGERLDAAPAVETAAAARAAAPRAREVSVAEAMLRAELG